MNQQNGSQKYMVSVVLDHFPQNAQIAANIVNGLNYFIAEQKRTSQQQNAGQTQQSQQGQPGGQVSVALQCFYNGQIVRFTPMQPVQAYGLIAPQADLATAESIPVHDLLGKTIEELDNDWAVEQPSRAIYIAVRNGPIGKSKQYSAQQVQDLIQARQNSGKWGFIYCSTNANVFDEAQQFGVPLLNTVSFINSENGIKELFRLVAQNVTQLRETGLTVAHNLGGQLQENGQLQKHSLISTKTWQAPQATA